MNKNLKLDITQWKTANQELLNSHILPIPRTNKWGKLVCIYKENRNTDKEITHVVTAIIEKSTMLGNIDDRKRKIGGKLFALFLYNIPLMLIQTLYHLSFAHMIVSIVKTVSAAKKDPSLTSRDIAKRVAKVCAQSFANIFRVIPYRLCLLAIAISALILPIFKQVLMYNLRQAYAKIEKNLNWGKKDFFISAACFQPHLFIDRNAEKTGLTDHHVYDITEYPLNWESFAKDVVSTRQDMGWNPFNGKARPKNVPYISSNITPEEMKVITPLTERNLVIF